jgi:ribonuclease HII
MLLPEFEISQAQLGVRIVGIDEVGRGSIAGPLVLSAFSFDPASLLACTEKFPELRDSKKLTQKRRELLSELLKTFIIRGTSQHFFVARSAEFISQQSLGAAVRSALAEIEERSHEQFDAAKTSFYLDGSLKLSRKSTQSTIIKGDDKYYSIAAAAILAKVHRDAEMRELAKKYPGYDFENNVGYGTSKHIAALRELGVTPEHRLSYKTFLEFSDSDNSLTAAFEL